jgi:hypothetical protein
LPQKKGATDGSRQKTHGNFARRKRSARGRIRGHNEDRAAERSDR